MKFKSLKINMLLNAIKGLLGVLFPLISFPYITKILGVNNIGKYNFSNSIVSYFVLISSLGIRNYAVREGAKIRDNKEKIYHFISQVFAINIVSTVISYLLFFLAITVVPKFSNYRDILLVLSVQIVLTTLGMEWIYGIYESYFYITLLNIISHIVSLLFLLIFVHEESDLLIYASITVFASVGTNVVNFFHSKRYYFYGIEFSIGCKKHLKPIFIFFAIQIATTVYISSDNTILGFLCDDHVIGIYAVSTKIYSIVKSILASILIVSVPRLSMLLGNNKNDEFVILSRDIYSTLLTLMVPAIVGIIILHKEIIIFISSDKYLSACSSLTILSIALLFCLCAWFWGQCILVPNNREILVFKATLISAIINVVLNLILIPYWKEDAAAITTLISETIAFFIQWKEGCKYVRNAIKIKEIFKIIVGCIPIIVLGTYIPRAFDNNFLIIVLIIFLSMFLYFTIQIILRNHSMESIVEYVKNKVQTR